LFVKTVSSSTCSLYIFREHVFFQGTENESKIFVCTTKSQLIDKSNGCITLNDIDAKVHWTLEFYTRVAG